MRFGAVCIILYSIFFLLYSLKGENMKKKTIPDDKYRVIKIGKEAIFEFLYESFTDKIETFFDISDSTTVVTGFDIDWDNNNLKSMVGNELIKNKTLHNEFLKKNEENSI